MSSNDDQFISKLQSDLSLSLDQIDDETKRQLYNARRAAVCRAAAKKESKQRRSFRWFSPASAAASFAGVSVIALTLWLMVPSPQATTPFNLVEDIALLSAPEELEFYEDLDFYIWLDHEEKSPT